MDITVTLNIRSPYNPNWIPAIQIPSTDIHRLSLRPLKWLRFVAFTVCGAYGDLVESPAGPVVDYNSVSHLADSYFYTGLGENMHLVDSNALDDRVTSSAETARRSTFRHDIMSRDGSCVVTRYKALHCDAAHIIPRSKGDEYITFIINDRRHLYEEQEFAPGVVSINAVVNGLFLERRLHSLFGSGEIVFLKTPNFAMQCEDVHRVEGNQMPDTRITMQYIEEQTALDATRERDIQMTGTGNSPPSRLLLDFAYGAAVVKRWPTDAFRQVLEQRTEVYTNLAPIAQNDVEDPEEPGRGYVPTCSQPGTKDRSTTEMLQAMDHMLVLSMLLKGHTPQQIAAEQERREKEKEAHAQEAGRVRVQKWLEMQGEASHS